MVKVANFYVKNIVPQLIFFFLFHKNLLKMVRKRESVEYQSHSS